MSKALIIVDVQNDFINGSMAITGADKIIPIINKMSEEFEHIVISKDWHPHDHCSFEENGGQWPRHCVANHEGSKLHKDLKTKKGAYFVQKGTVVNEEAYSAFSNGDSLNGLDLLLRTSLGVKEVFVCGLATDYCVLETALDAKRLGFETNVVLNACREVAEESCKEALKRMHNMGIKTIGVGFSNTEMLFTPM